MSLILSWICLDTVPSSTSPIRVVPAIVLIPSADKNIMSPPSSCIEWWAIVPTFFATSARAKLLELDHVTLYIRLWQNINNSLRKTFKPVTTSPTFISPAPVLKSSSVNGPENITECVELDMPP